MNFEIMNTSSMSMSGNIPVPTNPRAANVFHIGHLGVKLEQQKADFDLSDPNGYRLTQLYNCLHDPSLKSYLYRKDIHNHLITDGYITQDDKVICSVKEFNKYRNYLAEIQLDWDHKFKQEQKKLVRKLLVKQEQGKISVDVSVPDVMEWMLYEGRGIFRKRHTGKNRFMPRLHRKGDCPVTKLPKIATQMSDKDPSLQRASEREMQKMNMMLKKTIEEVKREMKYERQWSVAQQLRDKKRQIFYEKRTAAQKRTMQYLLETSTAFGSNLTSVRSSTLLQEEKIKQVNYSNLLGPPPMPRKLKPMRQTKKKHSGIKPSMIDTECEVSSMPGHKSSRFYYKQVQGPQPDLSVLAVCDIDTYRPINDDSEFHFTTTQKLQENDKEVYPEKCITAEELFTFLGNVVALVVKEVNGILIPAVQSFQCKFDTTSCGQMSKLLDHHEDPALFCVDQQYPPYVASSAVQHKHCLSNSSIGSLKPSLLKKAEIIVWEAIWKVMNDVSYMGKETENSKRDEVNKELSIVSAYMETNLKGNNDGDIFDVHGDQTKRDGTVDHKLGSSDREMGLRQHVCPISKTSTDLLSNELLDSMLEKVSIMIANEEIEVLSMAESENFIESSSRSFSQSSDFFDLSTTSEAIYFVSGGAKNQIQRAEEDFTSCCKLRGGYSSHTTSLMPSALEELLTNEIEHYADEMVCVILQRIKEKTEEECKRETNIGLIASGCKTKPIPKIKEFKRLGSTDTTQIFVDETQTTVLPDVKIRHQAVKVAHGIFHKIKMQFGKVDQGDIHTDINSMEEEDILVRKIVNTALEKLNIHMIKEFSETDTSKRSQGITDNFNVKLKGMANNPVSAAVKKCGGFTEEAPPLNLPSNTCIPKASEHGVRSQKVVFSLVTDVLSAVLNNLVKTSVGRTASASSNLEMMRYLVQALSSKIPESLPVNSFGSQVELVTSEILKAIVGKLKNIISQKRFSISWEHTELDFPYEAQDVVKEILQSLECQGTDISEYGPLAIDQVSSSISQTLLKHISESHLHKHNAEIPGQFCTSQLMCSLIPCVSGTELVKFRGSLSKTARSLLKETYGDRISNLRMEKELPACIKIPSYDMLLIQPHENNTGIILQRAAVEEVPPVAHNSKEWKQEAKHALSEVLPQTANNTSSSAADLEKMTCIDTGYTSTKVTCQKNNMELLQSTVEKFVHILMNQCKLPEMLMCQSEQKVICALSGDLELLNQSGLHASEELKMKTKSCSDFSPLLCDVVTKSVMNYVQWDNSPPQSTRDTDVKKGMGSKIKTPEPPWHSQAANTITESFLKMSPVKTAIHAEEEPQEQATQADWNEGENSQSKASDHHNASHCAQIAVQQLKSSLNLLELPVKKEPSSTTNSQTHEHSNNTGWFKVPQELSNETDISSGKRLNHTDHPISPHLKMDTIPSWVSCTDISEDIVIRVLDLISYCRSPKSTRKMAPMLRSADIVGVLIEVVMEELFTNTEMVASLEGHDPQIWHKPSLTDLETAARLVYEKLVRETGSVRMLQDALKLRHKLVVIGLANAVAKQVYKIFSQHESDSTSLPDQTSQHNDCPLSSHGERLFTTLTSHSNRRMTPVRIHDDGQLLPVESHSSRQLMLIRTHSNRSLTPVKRHSNRLLKPSKSYSNRHLPPELSVAQSANKCIVSYKAVWEIISSLLQNICPNLPMEWKLCLYAKKLFHWAIFELSEDSNVSVCMDETTCDVYRHPQTIELISKRVLECLQFQMTLMGYNLHSALEDRNDILCDLIVDNLVYETSELISMCKHLLPFNVMSSQASCADWHSFYSDIITSESISESVSATKSPMLMPGQTPLFLESNKVSNKECLTCHLDTTVSKSLSNISETRRVLPRASLSTVSKTKELSQMPGEMPPLIHAGNLTPSQANSNIKNGPLVTQKQRSVPPFLQLREDLSDMNVQTLAGKSQKF